VRGAVRLIPSAMQHCATPRRDRIRGLCAVCFLLCAVCCVLRQRAPRSMTPNTPGLSTSPLKAPASRCVASCECLAPQPRGSRPQSASMLAHPAPAGCRAWRAVAPRAQTPAFPRSAPPPAHRLPSRSANCATCTRPRCCSFSRQARLLMPVLTGKTRHCRAKPRASSLPLSCTRCVSFLRPAP